MKNSVYDLSKLMDNIATQDIGLRSHVIPKTKSAKKCYGSTSIVALVAQDIKAAPC